MFNAAKDLGGAIIFIDELDALGGSRERGDLHEASRRLLSVLLKCVGREGERLKGGGGGWGATCTRRPAAC